MINAFFSSKFGHCPLICFKIDLLNNRINKLQEKVLQLVYKDKASSSDEKREYFKVHQKNILKMATEMYKVKYKIAPKLMCELFEKTENL